MRTIKIAVIQLKNYYEDQAAGYTKAASMIGQAAAQGADMAMLPELSGCGYIPNQSIWQYAEPTDGKTSSWACELSAQFRIYIGAGFIETDGRDFYNSYVLTGPNGKICGVIRKESAEAYCFKRNKGDIYIDTEIGRVGVGICADNHYAERLYRMMSANIDLMLMPHASPAPYETSAQISNKDLEHFERQPYMVASTYSKYLRVPTVFVNAVGSFPEFTGGIGVKAFNESFRLMGGSLITSRAGELVLKMDSNEGFELSSVTIGTDSEPPVTPAVYHREWLHPGNTLYRCLVLPMVTRKGIRSYNKEHALYMNNAMKEQ
jgi:N-carbamoylputrescine amidase